MVSSNSSLINTLGQGCCREFADPKTPLKYIQITARVARRKWRRRGLMIGATSRSM